MKEDEDGWWGAPASKYWVCPECNKTSAAERWLETEVFCDDCGAHDARQCPECGEALDHVWGSRRIEAGEITEE
jgi:hypothetical protein